MRIVYVVNKKAVTPRFIPSIDQLMIKRRVIKQTPKGYRLCAPEAPADFAGFMYFHEENFFFDSAADALEEIARQANETAASFEAQKLDAIKLMCDAHDALRAEVRK